MYIRNKDFIHEEMHQNRKVMLKMFERPEYSDSDKHLFEKNCRRKVEVFESHVKEQTTNEDIRLH